MVTQNEYYKSLEQSARDIPNWNFVPITELANAYCDAYDKGDTITSDKYHCAIICRYWYMVSYIYERRTGNMLKMSFEDCQDIVIDGIARALQYRGWRDSSQAVSKELNGAKKVMDRCIYTEEMRTIKRLNTKKRSKEIEVLSMDYTYEYGDNETPLMDLIIDPTQNPEENGDLICKDVVNYYINKGNYKTAIIVDSICYQESLLKNLSSLGDNYIEYFSNKYSVNKNKLIETCQSFSKLSNSTIKRIVSNAVQTLRKDKEVLGLC